MPDEKISLMAAATALTGVELVEVVQGGVNKRTTTQGIADLAPAAGIQSVVGGTNVTVDDTDPLNPIVNASGGGGGAVDSVNGQTGVVALDAGDIEFTPAGSLSSTDVQAAIVELDTEKLAITAFAPYLFDRATPSTAGGTVTLDMNSQKSRMFVGSASFATPKTFALSNATNGLQFQMNFEVTNVAAVITTPADWLMADINFDGTTWTPPEVGKYVFGGGFDGTDWYVNVAGPYN